MDLTDLIRVVGVKEEPVQKTQLSLINGLCNFLSSRLAFRQDVDYLLLVATIITYNILVYAKLTQYTRFNINIFSNLFPQVPQLDA